MNQTCLKSIGLMLERFRSNSIPMHVLGRELGIPVWVMDIRHQVAHSVAVELNIEVFQNALEEVFKALTEYPKSYWFEQYKTYQKRESRKENPIAKAELKALRNWSNT